MRTKAAVILVYGFILVVVLAFFVRAQPTGPDTIQRGPSERGSEAGALLVEAQAGNVTGLTITATRVTNRWQGYFGNVTGTITLDDAADNTLYSWDLADPEGEIYASNGTVSNWDSVFCFNFTKTDAEQNVTLAELEGSLGMGTNDQDGVNETFNLTYTGSFTVGSVTIDENSGCSLVSLNVNGASDTLRFNETILTDNNSVIYTAILEQNQVGFQGAPADFQMLVGENGDTSEPTPYYFYVELS